MTPSKLLSRALPITLAAAVGWIAAPVPAEAQDKYPSRRVTLVVPFNAGTVTDSTARLLADQLKDLIGQAVIVENRGGAGGTLGAGAVAKAPPDGYTLLVGGNTTHSAAPVLVKNVPYDPVKDFTPIARIGSFPSVIVTNPQVPARTIQELVAHAKANPGKLTYGHGNSTGQITGEAMKKRLGLDIVRLPYTSNPQAITDTLTNNIQIMIADFLTGPPHISTGKLVAHATLRKVRSPLMPNIPTLHETVMPEFELVPWVSLFGPAGLPADIVKLYSDHLGTILAKPEIAARLHATGTEVFYAPAAEFAAYVVADLPRWVALAKEAGIEAQ